MFYWASRLSLDSFSSVVLYFGYLFLLALLDFLVTGEPLSLCGRGDERSHKAWQVQSVSWPVIGPSGGYILPSGLTEALAMLYSGARCTQIYPKIDMMALGEP